MAFLNVSNYFLHTTFILLLCFTFVFSKKSGSSSSSSHDYRDALTKSILFFQYQRSGKLPPEQLAQKNNWRGNSALSDGQQVNRDLTGGYYDAGDNLKFNFPMAFTTTMLSWSVIEFEKQMKQSGDWESAWEAINWATDYLLKCASEVKSKNKLYVGVGEPDSDHKCWERPEGMDTVRSVYWVTAGSDVAGETAAALAAASIVFKKVNPNYSKLLLNTAENVMQFAINYRGAYSDSLGSIVCPFYCSYSGYKDELFWGAAWLYRATKKDYYLSLIGSLGANEETDIFSWDNKYEGAHVLLSRWNLVNNNNPKFESFKQQAEKFMCRILPNSYSTSSTTQYTPGGLIFKMDSSNLQYVTSITFLLTTFAKYMPKNYAFYCGNRPITSNVLRSLAKKQVDYILGDNPMKMSYMVGYGTQFPQKIHHRGSSIPSYKVHPQPFGCDGGKQFFNSPDPNPNTLTGAIVGGPNNNDFFADDRKDYSHSEPATYINAAIVGPLAYFAGRN
ncbi:Endoglucanase 3 [Castilleja foliolosa]|uniref:Endoglucanase n=1 Tax=Castilleja foliolosa TaxID=1961234 RepID=A0ABD3D9C7_9LAMI